jgi:hypothetical protein
MPHWVTAKAAITRNRVVWAIIGVSGAVALMWWFFYAYLAAGTTDKTPGDVIFPSLAVFFVATALILMQPKPLPSRRQRTWQLILLLLIGTSVLLSGFSAAYAAHGKDFKPVIKKRPDAIYVAVGNLSTAGYPPFQAHGGATKLHELLLFQQLADMGWVLVVVAVGLQELTRRRQPPASSETTPPAASDPPVTASPAPTPTPGPYPEVVPPIRKSE